MKSNPERGKNKPG